MLSEMEDLFLKFPEVGQKVCKNLDNENLVNCKKVSKVLKITIDDQKHTWVRMIRHFACARNNVFPESWRPILTKSPTEILKHLGVQLKMSNEKQIMVGIKSRNIIVCNWTPLDLTYISEHPQEWAETLLGMHKDCLDRELGNRRREEDEMRKIHGR